MKEQTSATPPALTVERFTPKQMRRKAAELEEDGIWVEGAEMLRFAADALADVAAALARLHRAENEIAGREAVQARLIQERDDAEASLAALRETIRAWVEAIDAIPETPTRNMDEWLARGRVAKAAEAALRAALADTARE